MGSSSIRKATTSARQLKQRRSAEAAQAAAKSGRRPQEQSFFSKSKSFCNGMRQEHEKGKERGVCRWLSLDPLAVDPPELVIVGEALGRRLGDEVVSDQPMKRERDIGLCRRGRGRRRPW